MSAICFEQNCVTTPYKTEAAISRDLGFSDVNLIHQAVLLQGQVLTGFLAASGVFLLLSGSLIGLLSILNRMPHGEDDDDETTAARIALRLPSIIKVFAYLAVAWILVSSIATFQQIAAVKWTARVWGAVPGITFGRAGLALHWVALSMTVIYAVGVTLMFHHGEDEEDEEKPAPKLSKATFAKKTPLNGPPTLAAKPRLTRG
jgi:hypothetical protein